MKKGMPAQHRTVTLVLYARDEHLCMQKKDKYINIPNRNYNIFLLFMSYIMKYTIYSFLLIFMFELILSNLHIILITEYGFNHCQKYSGWFRKFMN